MNIEEQPKICVVIRKRPLNKKELQRNEQDIVVVKNGETVIVSEYKQKVDLTKYIEESAFNFDYAFDETINNDQIYLKAVRPLVQSAFLGARVTCFAYGQTGSGKTYTMNGEQGKTAGLYILGAKDIFALQSQKQYNHLKITVSFFEIYCGRLFDLLNARNELKLREDNKANIHIVGLEEKPIFNPQEFMQVIYDGSNVRITSQNSTNAESSRSHAILQIVLKQGKKIYGKISFIDLAGCERGADHMDQNKQTRIDGAEINKSLLSLKECIRALDQGKGHTPFRGSKLTMVLKDSFVGFCKTVMIGNISPNMSSCENTLNTLRYADRVKELKKPNSNQPMSKEDQLAKELMLPRMNKNAVKIMIDSTDDAEDIQNKKNEAQKLLGIRDSDLQPTQFPPYNGGSQSQQFSQPGPYGIQQPFNQFNQQFGQPQPIQFGQPPNNQFNQFTNNQFPNNQFNQPSNNQFNQQPQQQFNQSNNNLQQPTQLNQSKKVVVDDNKVVRKFSMDTGGPIGLVQQKSVGAKRAQNINQNKATISTNGYGMGPRQMDQEQQNNNKTIQLRPNSQSYQFQPSQQYGLPNNTNFNTRTNHHPDKMQTQPQPTGGHSQPQHFQPQYQSLQPNQQPNQQLNQQHQQQYYAQQRQSQQSSQFQRQPQPKSMPAQPAVPADNLQSRHFEWDKVVGQFSKWHPSDREQMAYFRDAHDFLINKLMEQQDHITNEHSMAINKQIEMIKDEMKVLGQIEKDRGSYQSIEYADIIQNAVDMKLGQLLDLKKKVTEFKKHLLEHQECQQKIFMAREELEDDEQLLDNLDEDGNQQRLF